MAADDAYAPVQAVARPDYPESKSGAYGSAQTRALRDNTLYQKKATYGIVQTNTVPGSPEKLYYWNGSSYVHAPRWRWNGTTWVEVI